MVLVAAAAVFLVPLILTPGLLFYYDITPKVALLMWVAALGLAGLWRELPAWIAFARTRWVRLYLLAAGAFLLVAGVSASRSDVFALAWYGSNWRRMGA